MRWLIYGALALLAALVVGASLFPLSLALKLANAPIDGEASGTLWRGDIASASAAGRPLGDIAVRTQVLPTLSGTPTARLAVDGDAGTGAGVVAQDGDRTTLSGVDVAIDLAPFKLADPFGRVLAGTVMLSGDAVFTPAGCETVAMTASTDAVAKAVEGFGQPGFAMTGPVVCEDGVLVADLRGGDTGIRAAALIRLSPGRYLTELTVATDDGALGQALGAYGFRRNPDGYTLINRGTW